MFNRVMSTFPSKESVFQSSQTKEGRFPFHSKYPPRAWMQSWYPVGKLLRQRANSIGLICRSSLWAAVSRSCRLVNLCPFKPASSSEMPSSHKDWGPGNRWGVAKSVVEHLAGIQLCRQSGGLGLHPKEGRSHGIATEVGVSSAVPPSSSSDCQCTLHCPLCPPKSQPKLHQLNQSTGLTSASWLTAAGRGSSWVFHCISAFLLRGSYE